MTALAADKTYLEYKDGSVIPGKLYRAVKIYQGANCMYRADGYVIPGADTAGCLFAGINMGDQVDNTSGSDGALTVGLTRTGCHKMTMNTAITIANVGDNVFLVDDNLVDVVANVTNAIFCGVIAEYIDTTHAYIDIVPAIEQADVATHIADTVGAHAASAISYADSGTFTDADEVDEALDEIYQNLLTAQGMIPIPMPNITDAGAALAAFSNGDSTVPGYCVTAKGLGIRWNNHATPGAVGSKVIVPPDADVTANMTLNILAAKTGATIGDATKFTVGAFNNDVGEAYDFDSTFGGDTGAMTGNATAKTVQHVTLTLALANLTAYPAAIELTIKPKDGTLGTDDVIMLGAWINYTKKILTS